MAVTTRPTGCCGMIELDNISQAATPKDVINSRVVRDTLLYSKQYPLVLFSGVVKRVAADHASSRKDDYGQALANFIAENKLGAVVRSQSAVNPVTQNKIAAWVWTPDHNALFTWYMNN